METLLRMGTVCLGIVLIGLSTSRCAKSGAKEGQESTTNDGIETGTETEDTENTEATDSGASYDSDTNTETESDTGPEGVPLCCGADGGLDRPWCEGKPKTPGKGCSDVPIIGRSNFASFGGWSKNINTMRLQDNFNEPCKNAAKPKGPDAWFAVFLFAGERISISQNMNFQSGLGSSFLYLVRPLERDFCKPFEIVQCKTGQMTTLNATVTTSGWYLVVLDKAGGYASGSVDIALADCVVERDCSCWLSTDDPDAGLADGVDAGDAG